MKKRGRKKEEKENEREIRNWAITVGAAGTPKLLKNHFFIF